MLEDIWKLAKHFIGTLSAFLVGITATLYAVGFITETAHFNMLGILGNPIDNIEYLKAGGLFFLNLLLSIKTAISYILSIVYKWEFFLFIGLIMLIGLIFILFKNKICNLLAFFTKQNYYKKYKQNILKSITLILSITVGLIILPSLFDSIKGNSNLLYYHIPKDKNSLPLIELLDKLKPSSEQDLKTIEFLKERILIAKNWENNKIRRYILEGESKALQIRFGLFFLWIIIFSVLISKVSKNPKRKSQEENKDQILLISFLKYIAIIVLLIQLLLILLSYGYTIQSNNYPIGEIELIKQENEASKNLVAILVQNNNYFIVYDRLANKQVIIYSRNEIKKIHFWGIEFIFRDLNYKKEQYDVSTKY